MRRLKKKFNGDTAGASSEPVSSENRTPKSLKPKPKISKNSLNSGTLKVQEKKSKKKKGVLGSKKVSINNDKEDDENRNARELTRKSTTGGKRNKKNQENINIKENGAGLESKRSQMNKEKNGGLQKKQHREKNKEKCSGLEKIEEDKRNEENHGQLESKQDEKKKEELGRLPKKQHPDYNKWFKKIEPVETNEDKHGKLESQRNEMNKEKLDGFQKKQQFDKNKEMSSWFRKIEPGHMNEEKDRQLNNGRNEKKKEKHGHMDEEKHSQLESERNEKKKEKHGHRNEEKHSQLESEPNEKMKEKLGGLIFMCNAKTKPDCFHFGVMGVTMSKKELVLGIKPGLKLFLYDYDLRLLYGIYTASSLGGMKLEPAAFGGAFPVQVRFNVDQDCYPLPESVFGKAIRGKNNERNKFDTELTVRQVNKLIELFRPAELQSHAPRIGPTTMPAMHDMKVEGARESLPHQHQDLGAQPYGEGRRYHVLSSNGNGRHLSYGEVPSTRREDLPQNYFPSETEYRTHGLLRVTPPRSQITPTLEPHLDHVRPGPLIHPGYLYADDPHLATTASPIDTFSKIPYSSHHYGGGSYLDPHRPPPSGREEVVPLQWRETYLPRGESYLTETSHHLGRRENVADAGMLYSTYASNALSEYSQINSHQEAAGAVESSLVPVSSRYSFAGPSLSHR